MKKATINYSIIWFFLKSHLKLFGFIFFLTLAVAGFESITLAALYYTINALFDIRPDSLTFLDRIFDKLTNTFGFLEFSDQAVLPCIILILALFARFILSVSREALSAYASGEVMYQSKKDIFQKYSLLSYDYFINEKQASILYKVTNATNRLTNALLGMTNIFSDILRILAIGIILAFVNIQLMTFLLFLTCGYYYLTNQVAKKRSYVTSLERLRSYTALTAIVSEFCTGFKNISVYRALPFWQNRFNQENKIYSKYFFINLVWLAIPRNVMLFLGTSALFLVALYFRLTQADTFLKSVSTMGIFTMATLQVLPAISSFGQKFMEVIDMQPDLEVVYELLGKPVVQINENLPPLISFNHQIEFRNVSFNYSDQKQVLNSVNFSVNKKEIVAIAGPSGAGKTTIINLLMGIYQPTKGSILVDGEPLENFQKISWLEKIGFVSQDAFTFHSTILDNILFGRSNYVLDDVIKVAKLAHAHDFISKLPNGYETVVGERGMKLSGGQQQRIAIARALLGNPDILIFDEATSALDSESELLIQNALSELSKEKTLIIVAHRSSTLKRANRVYVLADGKLIEAQSENLKATQFGEDFVQR